MTPFHLLFRKTTLLLLFLLYARFLFATNESDSLKQANEKQSIPNILMLSLSYTTNNIKTKNYEYSRIPAIITDVNFFHKKGFTSAFNYTYYYNASPNTYEAELQAGYQKNITENLNISGYYARRKFVGDTTYEGLAQKNTLALNALYNWKIFEVQLSNAYLNGKSDNYFLDIDLGLSLDIDGLLNENDFLLFNPTFSLSFGTDYWVFQNLSPARELIVRNFLQRNNFNSYQFEYQNASIFLPLIYNVGDFGIMINWFYSWPSAKLAKLNWKEQTGLLFSFYYTPNI